MEHARDFRAFFRLPARPAVPSAARGRGRAAGAERDSAGQGRAVSLSQHPAAGASSSRFVQPLLEQSFACSDRC